MGVGQLRCMHLAITWGDFMTFNAIRRAPSAGSQKLIAFGRTAFIAAAFTAFCTLPVYAAKPRPSTPGATIVIRSDMGGSVRARFNEIQEINRLKQRVEIRNGGCMSSCTMFLGVQNVCVTPRAVLGFHGPYRFGSKLTSAEFEEWSRVIAAHYPQAIRDWYLQKARYNTYTPLKITGTELIRLGVPRCA